MSTNSGDAGQSRTMKASEFKAKCLRLMDEVNENGGEIVITKNGKPVAKLTAFRERPKSLFGIDQGRLKILGDIVSPMPAEWFADDAPAEENLF